MELKDFPIKIKPFPQLANNADVMKLVEIIQSNSVELDKVINSLQSACEHKDFNKIYENPKKVFEWERGAVLAKECKNCGFIIEKPKGSAWVICENCWGEMEYLGREPGQGVGIQHYECKVCHRHHTHT